MVDKIAQTIFWLALAALFYVYIGYPILVYLISRAFPQKVKRAAFEPKVTVLITAYNEEKAIRTKLENTLKIDYPEEKAIFTP
ncbi:MAG: hypothetical protein ABJA66_13660 [Actinomycetota bacterium]